MKKSFKYFYDNLFLLKLHFKEIYYTFDSTTFLGRDPGTETYKYVCIMNEPLQPYFNIIVKIAYLHSPLLPERGAFR